MPSFCLFPLCNRLHFYCHGMSWPLPDTLVSFLSSEMRCRWDLPTASPMDSPRTWAQPHPPLASHRSAAPLEEESRRSLEWEGLRMRFLYEMDLPLSTVSWLIPKCPIPGEQESGHMQRIVTPITFGWLLFFFFLTKAGFWSGGEQRGQLPFKLKISGIGRIPKHYRITALLTFAACILPLNQPRDCSFVAHTAEKGGACSNYHPSLWEKLQVAACLTPNKTVNCGPCAITRLVR